MALLKDFRSFAENPFSPEGLSVKTKKFGSKARKYLDQETGEMLTLSQYSTEPYIHDAKEYRKVYIDGILSIKDLGTPALRILCFILVNLKPSKDDIFIHVETFCEFAGYDSKQPYYKGIVELLDKKFLAKQQGSEYRFFINSNMFFNGNRTKYFKPEN